MGRNSTRECSPFAHHTHMCITSHFARLANFSGLKVPFLNYISNLKARSGQAVQVRVGGNTQELTELYFTPFNANYEVINKTTIENTLAPVRICLIPVSHFAWCTFSRGMLIYCPCFLAICRLAPQRSIYILICCTCSTTSRRSLRHNGTSVFRLATL